MEKQTEPKPLGLSMAKKLILAVIIILCLGTALGVAGYLMKNKAVKISQPQVSPAPKPEATNQIIDETADLSSEDLATEDWKTYRNEKYGFEVKYQDNIFQLDSTKSTLSHTLKNFHKYSEKDGSDLGLASDISIVFKKEESTDKGCDYLEQLLDMKSNGIPFQSKNVSGIKYESGAEGEGVFDYCIKDNKGRNIFWIQKYFLKESYSTELPKQQDYIPSKEQERIFDQILSTFKFIEKGEELD